MPRIVAGTMKGRNLIVPRNVTRPTSSRVREALFDLLCHSPDLFDGVPQWQDHGLVADLYAGSGAVGFEALSRGARAVAFVESHHGACAVVRDNIRQLGVEGACRLVRGRLPGALKRLDGPFDLVFMDPPYVRWQDAGSLLAGLVSEELLAPGAVVVVEVPARELFSASRVNWPNWTVEGVIDAVLARRWGDTGVVIFRFLGYRAHVGNRGRKMP